MLTKQQKKHQELRETMLEHTKLLRQSQCDDSYSRGQKRTEAYLRNKEEACRESISFWILWFVTRGVSDG